MFAEHPLPIEYLADRPIFAVFAAADPLDSWGRPLLEWASVSHASTVVHASCPYADSRSFEGSVFNEGAFHALVSNYGLVLDKARWFAAQLAARAPPQNVLVEVWQFADLVCSDVSRVVVGALVAENDHARLNGDLCALQKICRGLRYACEVAIAEGIKTTRQAFARDMYSLADERGLLVGESEVCAASPALIRNFLNALFVALDQLRTRHHGSDWPNSLTLQTIVHGARCVAFIYESARVVVNSSGDTGYVDDCRHTFPAAPFAHECASNSPARALEHAHMLVQLYDSLPAPNCSLRQWTAEAQAALEMVFGNAAGLEGWFLLQEATLTALNALNHALCISLGPYGIPQPLLIDDLELFFGAAPARHLLSSAPVAGVGA